MSTKLYVAYKLRRADYLWPLVADIRQKATENVKEVLKNLYGEFMANVKTDSPLFKARLKKYEDGEDADWRARHSITHDTLNRLYRWNSVSQLRSPFNFDVSVGFRQFKGGIYLIPYCDWTMGKTLDFLKRDKRLRDYHYQNSTDRPKHIPERQWRERRTVWHTMDATGQFQDALFLDICKYSTYYAIDPWFDMIRERNAAKKT